MFEARRVMESLVYYDGALESWAGPLPGIALAEALDERGPGFQRFQSHITKLAASGRKLCMMQLAIDQYGTAERNIYEWTVREAMAWDGRHAAEANFTLEAAVLFARASLDVASQVFSRLMPDPYSRDETTSFNKFTKRLAAIDLEHPLVQRTKALREGEERWFGWLVGYERGRALRDQVAHKMEFPLVSVDRSSMSNMEKLVVNLGDYWPEPSQFFQELVDGVCGFFVEVEKVAAEYVRTAE